MKIEDSENGVLSMHISEDGDISLTARRKGSSVLNRDCSVRFCAGIHGGFKATNTRVALLNLYRAIEADLALSSPQPPIENQGESK